MSRLHNSSLSSAAAPSSLAIGGGQGGSVGAPSGTSGQISHMRNELSSYRAAVQELEGLVQELDRQRTSLKSELTARERMCVALQCASGAADLKQAMFAIEKELKKSAKARADSEAYLEQARAHLADSRRLRERAVEEAGRAVQLREGETVGIERQLRARIEQLEAALQDTIEDADRRLQDAEAELSSRLDDAAQARESDLDAADEERRAAVAAAEAAGAARAADLLRQRDAEWEARLAKAKAEAAAELERIQAEVDRRVAAASERGEALRIRAEEDVRALRQAHERERRDADHLKETIKCHYEAVLEDARRRHRDEVSAVEAKAQAEREAAAAELASRLSSLDAAHEKDMATLRRECIEEVVGLRERNAASMEALEASLRREAQESAAHREERAEAERQESLSREAAIEDRWRAVLQAERARHAEEVDALNRQHGAQLTRLTSGLAELQEQLAAEAARAQSDNALLEARHGDALDALRSKYEARLASATSAAERQLDEMVSLLERERVATERAIIDLREAHARDLEAAAQAADARVSEERARLRGEAEVMRVQADLALQQVAGDSSRELESVVERFREAHEEALAEAEARGREEAERWRERAAALQYELDELRKDRDGLSARSRSETHRAEEANAAADDLRLLNERLALQVTELEARRATLASEVVTWQHHASGGQAEFARRAEKMRRVGEFRGEALASVYDYVRRGQPLMRRAFRAWRAVGHGLTGEALRGAAPPAALAPGPRLPAHPPPGPSAEESLIRGLEEGVRSLVSSKAPSPIRPRRLEDESGLDDSRARGPRTSGGLDTSTTSMGRGRAARSLGLSGAEPSQAAPSFMDALGYYASSVANRSHVASEEGGEGSPNLSAHRATGAAAAAAQLRDLGVAPPSTASYPPGWQPGLPGTTTTIMSTLPSAAAIDPKPRHPTDSPAAAPRGVASSVIDAILRGSRDTSSAGLPASTQPASSSTSSHGAGSGVGGAGAGVGPSAARAAEEREPPPSGHRTYTVTPGSFTSKDPRGAASGAGAGAAKAPERERSDGFKDIHAKIREIEATLAAARATNQSMAGSGSGATASRPLGGALTFLGSGLDNGLAAPSLQAHYGLNLRPVHAHGPDGGPGAGAGANGVPQQPSGPPHQGSPERQRRPLTYA